MVDMAVRMAVILSGVRGAWMEGGGEDEGGLSSSSERWRAAMRASSSLMSALNCVHASLHSSLPLPVLGVPHVMGQV